MVPILYLFNVVYAENSARKRNISDFYFVFLLFYVSDSLIFLSLTRAWTINILYLIYLFILKFLCCSTHVVFICAS